jgi:hypothetical protein
MQQTNDAETDAVDEQIDKSLVAPTLGVIGEKINPHLEDSERARYLNVASEMRQCNVDRCLLIDSENPHDELLYGWTNDNRSTWKIADRGKSVNVTSADLEIPESETQPDEDADYVQEWIAVLIDEYRHDVEEGAISPSVNDIITFAGPETLRINDEHGHKTLADISLD